LDSWVIVIDNAVAAVGDVGIEESVHFRYKSRFSFRDLLVRR
jgi:hypothetical protein